MSSNPRPTIEEIRAGLVDGINDPAPTPDKQTSKPKRERKPKQAKMTTEEATNFERYSPNNAKQEQVHDE